MTFDLAVAILALLVGAYGIWLTYFFRKQDLKPNIHITGDPIRNSLEIYNIGGDLLEAQLKIYWMDGIELKTRDMGMYSNREMSPMLDFVIAKTVIKKGETKYADSFPTYSMGGKVSFEISGEDSSHCTYFKKGVLGNHSAK